MHKASTSGRRLDKPLLDALKTNGPLDDDQLGTVLGTTRQSARGAALRLSKLGIVRREIPAGGKWMTALGREPIAVGGPRHAPPGGDVPLTKEVILKAIEAVYAFTRGDRPQLRLHRLEQSVKNLSKPGVDRLLASEEIDNALLRSSLVIKQLAGEIHVVIHALGIMLALPHLLEEGESVVAVSLGAGTGNMKYDLETTNRIAEFKFIRWRGNDAVRQDGLFADFVKLAESGDPRQRQLFVVGAILPHHFLFESNRSLSSVCARRPKVLKQIQANHGSSFRTVSEYATTFADQVKLVDLESRLPAYVVKDIENASEDVE
jgi:hypothetical protein